MNKSKSRGDFKMKNLMFFENSEFGKLEILTIDGKHYFPATDCAEMLGYKDSINAIKQHCRWVVKHHVPHPQSPEKKIEKNYIPEGDLYRLIAHSKLPGAEKFESWVFDVVLP
jgi:anti-repressor protein